MAKRLVIETLELNDIYFDENSIAQNFTRYEYLVKRASDGKPIAQYKVLSEAEKHVREDNNTLEAWFEESKDNKQAIYDARNGQRYVYHNGQKLSKFAKDLQIEQVVELDDKSGYGAWLW